MVYSELVIIAISGDEVMGFFSFTHLSVFFLIPTPSIKCVYVYFKYKHVLCLHWNTANLECGTNSKPWPWILLDTGLSQIRSQKTYVWIDFYSDLYSIHFFLLVFYSEKPKAHRKVARIVQPTSHILHLNGLIDYIFAKWASSLYLVICISNLPASDTIFCEWMNEWP